VIPCLGVDTWKTLKPHKWGSSTCTIFACTFKLDCELDHLCI